MDVVYVLAGGDFITAIFNGVATMFGTTTWSSMFRIVLLISVMTLFATYLKHHDPKEFLTFMAFFILLTSVMVVPKRTVQIIDRSDPTFVKTVANVPLGLAVPAKFITSIGTGVTESMEAVFHTVDSLAYSKTGMLFGSAMVADATDFTFKDGNIAELFTAYVRNCVVGDITLNNKYSLEGLMRHPKPYELIFENPSPLRGIMVPEGNSILSAGFQTCKEVASSLSPKLNADTSQGGSTWKYYSRKTLNAMAGSPSTDVLFGTLMADSYNYYYGGGQTASEIMRSSVVMNGIRQGLSSYSAHNGDAASLINLASQSSYNKMRISQTVSSDIAVKYIPILNTVLLGLVIGLFPVTILLATIHVLTANMLKMYIVSWVYLQSWAPMFCILNYAVDSYLRTQSGALNFNLASLSAIQQTHSDVGMVAGWLSASIPFLAIGIAKGFGSVMSQAGNYLGTAINSTASSESSRASDGLWSLNSMQMDNVAGNKWDTNYSHRDGHMTQQLANGATATRTTDGTTLYDTATSKLSMDLGFEKSVSAGAQRQARESIARAESLNESLGHSSALGATQLTQWANQRGNSNTQTSGADSSNSASVSSALNTLHSTVQRLSKAHNVSEGDVLKNVIQKSGDTKFNAGASVHAKLNSEKQIGGKVAQMATGFSLGAEGHAGLDYTGSNYESHGIDSDKSSRMNYVKDLNANEQKDLRDAIDTITNYKTTDSSSKTDNESGSLVNQIAANFNDMRNKASQYNEAVNRSHEYAQIASYAENNSASLRSNYAQEFVGFVQSYSAADAETLLTNTSSPAVRMKREQLADEFANQHILPSLQEKFRSDRAGLSDGIASVSKPDSWDVNFKDTYQQDASVIEKEADNRGVKGEGVISSQVQQSINNTEKSLENQSNLIQDNRHSVSDNYKEMEQTHHQKEQQYVKEKSKEKELLESFPGEITMKEMKNKALDINNWKKGK